MQILRARPVYGSRRVACADRFYRSQFLAACPRDIKAATVWADRILLMTRESGTVQSRTVARCRKVATLAGEVSEWTLSSVRHVRRSRPESGYRCRASVALKRRAAARDACCNGLLSEGFHELAIAIDAVTDRMIELPGQKMLPGSVIENGSRYVGANSFANPRATDWTDSEATLESGWCPARGLGSCA